MMFNALRSFVNTDSASVRLVPGEPVLALGSYDLAGLGFHVEEFFIAGTARCFTAPDSALGTALGTDGRWRVAAGDAALFKTRIIVLRPAISATFSGTVVVEWLNVSAGMDMAPDWVMIHREVARSGHAYVAVSCQRVGVEGGPSMGAEMSLKTLNLERYASLTHPGDAYSYDIFTQVGLLLRGPEASGLLGGLQPRHIIAAGESQSATYLVTYINAVDPLAKVFDGYLVHSRGTIAGQLSGQSIFVGEQVRGVRLREDLRVPTMLLQTETDLLALNGLAVRQPDNDRLRTWEIAGAAHADNYFLAVGMIDSGEAGLASLAAAFEPLDNIMGNQLAKPVNGAPQHHYVAQAALHWLNVWVTQGRQPPAALALELDPTDAAQLARDTNGNALGGIRTPWMDVPTGCHTGVGEAGTFSYLFGGSTQFDQQKLAQLYPAGASQYLELFKRSLDHSIEAGFILPADRAEIMGLAELAFCSAAGGVLP